MVRLFLDLEDTVIKSWDEWYFCKNIEKIKELIFDINPDEIYIYSYAIWNEEDKVDFNKWKHIIENKLEIEFSKDVWSIEDMMNFCRKKLKVAIGKDDFFCFMNKEISFRLICEHLFNEGECILIDDTVNNTTLKVDSLSIRTIYAKGI